MNNKNNKVTLSGIVGLGSFFGGSAMCVLGAKSQNAVTVIVGFGIAFLGVAAASVIQSVMAKKSQLSSDMSKNAFEHTANNKSNKPALSGLIALVSFAVGFAMCIYGARRQRIPLFMVGFGIAFFGIAAASIIQSVMAKKNQPSSNMPKNALERTAQKYEPLLLDERTKQYPEVQRLLQYPSVQKVFFDPEFLKTAAAQSDPQVCELLAVLDNIMLDQTANGAYPLFGQGGYSGNAADPNALTRKNIERRENEKNKPRRTAGIIVSCVGLMLFITPFFAGRYAEFFFFLDPIGMVLIIVGSVMMKR